MNSQREAFESIIKIAFDGVGGNKADRSLMDIRSIALDQFKKLSADCKPVAWRHDDPDRVDVIEDCVKQLLIECSPSDSKGIQRPIDKVEHYTIPLYEWQAAAEQGVGEPVAYMLQHEDTGQIIFEDVQQIEWGFQKNNPRYQLIGPVYPHPPKPTGGGVPLSDDQILNIAGKIETCPCSPWWLKDDVTGGDVRAATLRFARALLVTQQPKD